MSLLSPCRDERGFTMVTVTITMLVVMLLSVAALTAAQGDLPAGKHDTDRKIAYAAAEAGVQNYLFHLVDDPSYWSKCTVVGAPVNDPWDGTSSRRWASVPGSRARYTIELMPANGNPACAPLTAAATTIDAGAGTLRIRVTGQALGLNGVSGVKRTIVVNLRRESLLDYVYLTDKENLDPSLHSISTGGRETDRNPTATVEDVNQWGNSQCQRYHGNGSSGNRAGQHFDGDDGIGIKIGSDWYDFTMDCQEITFASQDVVKGPLHTNDEILCAGGTPVKLGRMPSDRIEVFSEGQASATPTGYRGCTPYVNFGTSTSKADAGALKTRADAIKHIGLPSSNGELKTDTAPAYRFYGRTKIRMNGTQMTVLAGEYQNGTSAIGPPINLPADGLVYVFNKATPACAPYNPVSTATASTGCGNLEIEGNYGVNVTFAAENDILVTEDITRVTDSEALLGLIANNFIRVHHPVTSLTFTPDYNSGYTRVNSMDPSCTNSAASPSSVRIDASILSLNHSFIVDNFYCGGTLGTLVVNGAIAQSHRGAVGRGTSGYLKNYSYDDRLKYRSPPKFLNPVDAAWRVQTYNEQIPAR